MFSKSINKLLLSSYGGYQPHLETPPSIVDSCPSSMMLANGGMFAKKDKIHLDRSAGYESHDTPIMPRNVFEAELVGRGFVDRLKNMRNVNVQTSEVAPSDEVVEAPVSAE